MSTFLGVIILVLSGLIVLLIGQIWIMNFPWGANTIEDITSGPLPLFHAQDPAIRRLANLGFQSLGTLNVRLFWSRKFSQVWCYIDPSATTYAEVTTYKSARSEVMVAFLSWFSDGALIETFFPMGENIDEPAYSAHFVQADLEKGYTHHQEVIRQWAARHGEPVVIHDVRHLISYDEMDTKLHRRRRYRRITMISSGLIVSLFTSILSLLYIIQADVNLSANGSQVIDQLLIPTTLLLLCFGAVFLLLRQITDPPGALDRKA